MIPVSSDCPALEEEFSENEECPKGVMMELLGQINHPYIYPILDLNFFHTPTTHYACLVIPVNPRGSLKDFIHKVRVVMLKGDPN
jgi:PX domain-containing protein kinase-like protein